MSMFRFISLGILRGWTIESGVRGLGFIRSSTESERSLGGIKSGPINVQVDVVPCEGGRKYHREKH